MKQHAEGPLVRAAQHDPRVRIAPDPSTRLLRRLQRVANRNRALRADFAGVLENFIGWSQPFVHLWRHARVSAAIFRINGEWIVRAAGVVLTDTRPKVAPPVATDDVWMGRWVLDIETLPALVEDIIRGRISRSRNPLRQLLLLKEAKDKPLSNVYGSTYESSSRLGVGALYRHTIDVASATGLSTWFENDRAAQDWNKRAERIFGAKGCGDFETVVKRLDITADRSKLLPEHPTVLRITAAVPLMIAHMTESTDRTMLSIDVMRGATVDSSRAMITIEPRDAESSVVEVPVVESGPATLPNQGDEKLVINLLYNGERIQRFCYQSRSLLQEHLRHAAMSALEGRPLLREGLLQNDTKLDASWFERSMAHLLGLLGFSVFWWGAQRGIAQMPAEQADLLAVSADDSVVLLVECTLRPNDIKKVGKLFHRAKDIAARLREATADAPDVVPVLAIAAPRESVMRKLQTAGENEEITVFALEDITSALSGIERGAPHVEIISELPYPLRMGLRGLGTHDLTPDQFWM